MKKLSKKEQKKINGGKAIMNFAALCRPLLAYCNGPAKSDCPDYMECINSCPY
jgi:hypothetical protein